MTKIHRIEVLCTSEEKERIKNTAYAKGFPTISAFIRDFALRNPLTVESRVADIDRRTRYIEKMVSSLLQSQKSNYLSK